MALTVNEIAEKLACHHNTIRNYIRMGKIRARKKRLGSTTKLLIEEKELERFLLENPDFKHREQEHKAAVEGELYQRLYFSLLKRYDKANFLIGRLSTENRHYSEQVEEQTQQLKKQEEELREMRRQLNEFRSMNNMMQMKIDNMQEELVRRGVKNKLKDFFS